MGLCGCCGDEGMSMEVPENGPSPDQKRKVKDAITRLFKASKKKNPPKYSPRGHKFTGEANAAPPKLQKIMHMEKAEFKTAERTRTCVKMSMKAGMQWSKDVKPLVKTDSCQKSHFGILTKGKIRVIMDDGSVNEYEGGTAYYIPPGHDAEVLEDTEGFEFEDNFTDIPHR